MQSYQRFQHTGHTAFNTSGTNGPRSLSRAKVGIHSPLPIGSHTAAYTPKQGLFRMGALLLPSERFTRFGNPAWPGVRTANFAAFGSWSEALLKDTESLRNSDALMRVTVPQASRPRWAALPRLQFGDVAVFSLCAQGFPHMRKRGRYHYPRRALRAAETPDDRLSKELICRFLRSSSRH